MPRRADRPARKAGRCPQTCRAKLQICAHVGCGAPTHRRPVLPAKKGSAPPNGAKSLPMVRFSPSIDTLYYRIHDYAVFVNRPHCNIARLGTFLLARPRAGPLFAGRPPPCRRGGHGARAFSQDHKRKQPPRKRKGLSKKDQEAKTENFSRSCMRIGQMKCLGHHGAIQHLELCGVALGCVFGVGALLRARPAQPFTAPCSIPAR